MILSSRFNDNRNESQRWIRDSSTPILSPSQPWEGTAIQEFRPAKVNGNYLAAYSASFSLADQRIGLADSSDGKVWIKRAQPIIGGNLLGQPGGCGRPCLFAVDSTHLELYYTDGIPGTGYWWRVKSADAGTSWTNREAVLTPDDLPIAYGSNKFEGWCNAFIALDGAVYRLVMECFLGGGYAVLVATSADRNTWSSFTQVNGLIVGGNRGTASTGYWEKENNLYHLFPHLGIGAPLPSEVFHATSPDFINWTVRESAFPIKDEINTNGVRPVDQTADMRMLKINGIRYAYYARTNNIGEGKGDIALASFDGTLADLYTPLQ